MVISCEDPLNFEPRILILEAVMQDAQLLMVPMERRSADRVFDDSTILVKGCLHSSPPYFYATGKIEDVSPNGISFLLNCRLEKDQRVELTLCPEQIQGAVFKVKARILRVSAVVSDYYSCCVVALFESEFVETRYDNTHEQFAEQIENAVECDEHNRSVAFETCQVKLTSSCAMCGLEFDGTRGSQAPHQNYGWCPDCSSHPEEALRKKELESALNELAL